MAAAYPPWVLFERSCTTREDDASFSSIADTNTLASCRTTSGHPISVSLCLAAPPEGSRVCVRLPDCVEESYAVVVAAHGDSVVVKVAGIKNRGAFSSSSESTTDHFVYSAGDAAAEPPRPPALSLLAPHSITYEEDKRHPDPACRHLWRRRECHSLDRASTGLLRRHGGDGDFLVAELKMEHMLEEEPPYKGRKEAALHLLRSGGSGEWWVKRPVIRRHGDGGGECVNLTSSWETSTVIAVGDRTLCWVDLSRGLLFSDDVFGESPSLRYLPLPVDPYFGRSSYRNVCVTGGNGGSTIKFANVFPRCCCGGAGKSYCRGSHNAYTIHTWTLRMDDGGGGFMGTAWAMDGNETVDMRFFIFPTHVFIPH